MTVRRRRADKRVDRWAGYGRAVVEDCPAPWCAMDPETEHELFDVAARFPAEIFAGANTPWYYALARLGWASDVELREMIASEVSYCTKLDPGTFRQTERLREVLEWANANDVSTSDLPDWWDRRRHPRHRPQEWAEGRP